MADVRAKVVVRRNPDVETEAMKAYEAWNTAHHASTGILCPRWAYLDADARRIWLDAVAAMRQRSSR